MTCNVCQSSPIFAIKLFYKLLAHYVECQSAVYRLTKIASDTHHFQPTTAGAEHVSKNFFYKIKASVKLPNTNVNAMHLFVYCYYLPSPRTLFNIDSLLVFKKFSSRKSR